MHFYSGPPKQFLSGVDIFAVRRANISSRSVRISSFWDVSTNFRPNTSSCKRPLIDVGLVD
jgi:hypothetical protein